MTADRRTIQSGLYVIVDPSMDQDLLISSVKSIVTEGIAALQVWDNFGTADPLQLIHRLSTVCHAYNVPVLVNNRWELLSASAADGIHFDDIPEHITEIRRKLNRKVIIGITCGNDISRAQWAVDHHIDYLSFCSMFHSSTANSCELVDFDSVRAVQKITSIPFFLAGGITPDRVAELSHLNYAGIAVVSGIMSHASPRIAVRKYLNAIHNDHENRNH